jgi:(p)ppGpp synthase/HD superfamily hydrolase
MILTEKHVREARLVAIKAHGTQDYDGIFPYEKHLDDVVDVLKRFHVTDPETLCAAYLHDSMEDGSISYKDIKKHFGVVVAEMVYCVTDEMGRDRAEKKRKTLPKTTQNVKACKLKVGDRIANIEMGGKVDMYKKEFDEFQKWIYKVEDMQVQPMWAHLRKLVGIKEPELV